MKTLLKHLKEQPFLAAVSAAAVVHSSWSLSTYFTGPEPHFGLEWGLWIIPGLLLAFSIDVGLLSLAHQIRSGHLNVSKLLAFFVLSLAMAYSQFLYIVAHLPAVPIAPGVRADWAETLTTIRDAAVVVLPLLLPLALILYAFSDVRKGRPSTVETRTASEPVTETALVAVVTHKHPATCQACGRLLGEYDTELGAEMALRAHSKHCSGVQVLVPEEVEVEQ